ncbi:MAG: hypothetical protein ACK2T0_13985 [Anaerolineales bacterium]|jgi:hypothetical protein
MNHNPWYVDNAADYERQRIRDDMRQIRLEQKALKAEARKSASSRTQPSVVRTVKHATLAVAQAVITLFA